MGYTHYWKIRNAIPVEQWTSICADALKLIEAFRDVQNVKVDAAEITFDSKGCERFRFSRHTHRLSRYCKTRHEAGDKLICAVLMIATQISPESVSVSSDACMGSQPDGWPAAAKWASKVLGHKVKTPWKYSFRARMRAEWHNARRKFGEPLLQKVWLRCLGEWIALKVHFKYWREIRPFVRCPICHSGWLDQTVVRAFQQDSRLGVACCDRCCTARGIEIVTE